MRFEPEFEILENDISYREGILEYLEKNKNIDVLIIYEKIIGDISFIELIKKIKTINNEISIVFILENKNEEFEKLLKSENIKNIFYLNEVNINELINKIKSITLNSENNLNNEIMKLKSIINEKNKEILKYKNENNSINKRIIAVIGEKQVGKTLIISNIKSIVSDNMIDFCELNIDEYLESSNTANNYEKIIFIIEAKIEKMIKIKRIMNKLIFQNKINSDKIFIMFNKVDKNSPNIRLAKNIFREFKYIGKISFDNYSDYINNKNNNYLKENKNLENIYKKIFDRINI